MPRKQARRWSYSAGERGRNRVRIFENRHGTLYVEFYEETDGVLKPRRESLGHKDHEKAKRQADQIAAGFGDDQPKPARNPTLQQLFDKYLDEVSSGKSTSKRAHDDRAARMFLRLFGKNRKATTLNVRDWDRFIALRRQGRISTRPGRTQPVANRQIEYDLKFLRAVLNWAVKARDDGHRLLESNPWYGLPLPKERNPKRPIVDEDGYSLLRGVASEFDWRFKVALVLAHETGHRIGAIRHLQWADVDFDHRLVTWRASHDKTGTEHVTPLTDTAVDVLNEARRNHPAIGSTWVLPSPRRPDHPCSRQTLSKWFKRALRMIGLGHASGLGYHSFRRKFATELDSIPLKQLMALGGWSDPKTLVTCYQHPDVEAMRTALRKRGESTHQSTHLHRAEPDAIG